MAACCMMCGKKVEWCMEVVQNKLGPMTFWYCSEEHESLYWHLRNSSVSLHYWLRKPPGSRGPHLLRMTADELAHAEACVRVFTKNGRVASKARPPHCLRVTYH